MPLQRKRRGQAVYVFIQKLHYAIVAAVHVDLANPDRARRFNLHRSVGCSNAGPAHPSKTFPHALKKPCPIVFPLIPVIVTNQISDSVPISAVDCAKEMFCVKADLMFGSPKPQQIDSGRDYERCSADERSAKCNGHTRRLLFQPVRSMRAMIHKRGFCTSGH